jgi:1-acyl-sn-glycerol-3-phosphate acyltransferase
MQNVVIDRPYAFVPPGHGRWWPRALQQLLPYRLRRHYGIVSVTCRGLEKLRASLDAGDGVLVAPNHCRPCDPEVVHEMSRQAGALPYLMASWHLFMQGRLQAFLLRTTGTFSVHREGTDRASLDTAVRILERGGRPLVIFPEGVCTRTNDRLNPLLEGAAFVARLAARNRAKAAARGGVVVHPVGLRYRYAGDVRATVAPVLAEIEQRLSWRPQEQLSLEERVTKVGLALLALREIEVFGEPRTGTVAERTQRVIDGLLVPLEEEWVHGPREKHVVARVKTLRTAVLHDLIHGTVPPEEHERRWRQMADMYVAQAISFYPPDYLESGPTPERLLETVERFEEDLTDRCRRHEPLEVTVTVGDAIVVSPMRERGGDDPLLAEIDRALRELLQIGPAPDGTGA